MRFMNKLGNLWHDVYYFLAPPGGVDFAMRCRDVVERIDAPAKDQSWLERFRFILHLSLCQLCKNYFDFHLLLKRSQPAAAPDLKPMNQKLLNAYAKKKDP